MALGVTGIAVSQEHGRWVVTHSGRTVSLHYTGRDARQAAFDYHLKLWPDDDRAEVARRYGAFHRAEHDTWQLDLPAGQRWCRLCGQDKGDLLHVG